MASLDTSGTMISAENMSYIGDYGKFQSENSFVDPDAHRSNSQKETQNYEHIHNSCSGRPSNITLRILSVRGWGVPPKPPFG